MECGCWKVLERSFLTLSHTQECQSALCTHPHLSVSVRRSDILNSSTEITQRHSFLEIFAILLTPRVFLPQLAMERTPSVKAAPCAPETTAAWTASPNSSCSCGGRGCGSTGNVSTTVQPATTAYAAQSSTFAPVSPCFPFQTPARTLQPPRQPRDARAQRTLPSSCFHHAGFKADYLPLSPSGFHLWPERLLTSPLRRFLCVTVYDERNWTFCASAGEALQRRAPQPPAP